MKKRLEKVQTFLQNLFDNIPDDQKHDPVTGQPVSFNAWCGIREEHKSYYPGGPHKIGNAIDLNYSIDPYVATRTGKIFGGEQPNKDHPIKPTSLREMRERAVRVYDRALQFMATPMDQAKVHEREMGEATIDVYNRFLETSLALVSYFGFVIQAELPSDGEAPTIKRPPIADVEHATPEQLDRIQEHRPKDQALELLKGYMETEAFQTTHPDWPHDVETQYYEILRDFELVRIPMVVGKPSLTPAETRNPAFGLLNIRREVVIAMSEVGRLRWGACDFGRGSSGDMMHFDINKNWESTHTPRDLGDILEDMRSELDTNIENYQKAVTTLTGIVPRNDELFDPLISLMQQIEAANIAGVSNDDVEAISALFTRLKT